MNISEQIILVTGGAGDIGRSIANNLLPFAKKVIVLDIIDESFDELNKSGIDCYKCDLTNSEQTSAVIKKIFEVHPALSVVINCAGSIYSAPMINLLSKERKHSIESWNRIIAANLSSVFYVSLEAVEKMVMKRTKGLIINVSSISSSGNVGQTAYSAAKAGVNALTATWGKELSMFGIRSAAISPGFIDTPSTKAALSESNLEKIKKSIPLKRLGTLEEISKAVEFIIQNDYFNGKILELDGGLTL